MTPLGLSPDDMLRIARCASFKQAMKMELWNASEQHVLPSEAELDAIAGRLFDTFYKEIPMTPDKGFPFDIDAPVPPIPYGWKLNTGPLGIPKTPHLAEFVAYCKQNPEQRFWQALRNHFGYDYIYGQKAGEPLEDTFYKE